MSARQPGAGLILNLNLAFLSRKRWTRQKLIRRHIDSSSCERVFGFDLRQAIINGWEGDDHIED
jgi:hypothetical protein